MLVIVLVAGFKLLHTLEAYASANKPGSIPRSAFVFCGWENVCTAYVWSVQAYLRLTERSPITDHAHACSKRSEIDTVIS